MLLESRRFALVLACTLAACAHYASAVPSTVIYAIPQGQLTDSFDPSPPGAFNQSEAVHCFSMGSNGVPNFVRGMAQGYWYYEGPIVPGQPSILSLLANAPVLGQPSIIGTMAIQYAPDFMSATIISVSCSPSSWCSKWPSQLVAGRAASVDTVTSCLWQSGVQRGNSSALISKWKSGQGTTWMCSTPTSTQVNAVSGSWLYNNNQAECKARGEKYPCTPNYGPYTVDSMVTTLSDGGGMLMSQWFGWNFGQVNGGFADGRSIFVATSASHVQGSYCVYNDATGKIKFCYPEGYAIVGTSNSTTCGQFMTQGWTIATSGSASMPSASCSSSQSKQESQPQQPDTKKNSDRRDDELSQGAVAAIVLGVLLSGALVMLFFMWRSASQARRAGIELNGRL
jgi:hypothetical protein